MLITAWLSGRAGVRQLFAGLLRWRIGTARWLLVLLGLPLTTLGVAAATGTRSVLAAGVLRNAAGRL